MLDDYPFFITIHVEVMSGEAFRERSNREENARKDMSGREWERWSIREHPSIDRHDSDLYSQYRYDQPCADGKLIHMRAEVRHLKSRGTQVYAKEDDEIVRRILGSAACIQQEGLR